MVNKTLLVCLVLTATFSVGSCFEFNTVKFFVPNLISTIVTSIVKLIMRSFPPTIKTTNIKDIGNEYDFVIVGSGPAGCAVAARLSEVTEWNILLLEVGKSESWIASVPFFSPLMQWTDYNWGYKMQPQDNVCKAMIGKTCEWPRGRALGGTSTINYMIYTRGNKADFDILSEQGNVGWDYETVLKYYKKGEDCHLNDSIIDKEYHGTGGPLSTENTLRTKLTDLIVKAGNGDDEYRDYNGEDQMVYAPFQGTLKHGRRHSAAKAYLEPNLHRKNLHILTEAFVTRIILDEKNTAQGVDYVHKGKKHTVKVRKEVILSAGTFHSPQLLMLAGIGPRKHLEKLNIPVRIDKPVGQNLQDHIAYLGANIHINHKFEDFFSFLRPWVFWRWLKHGTGPVTSLGGVTAVGYMKTSAATYSENMPDMEFIMATVGDFTSDYGWINRKSFAITDTFYNTVMREKQRHKGAFLAVPMLLHPKSKGYIELNSANPYDPPKLYGNYFSHPQDKKAFIAAIRRIMELCETPPMKQLKAKFNTQVVPECKQYGHQTDQYFDCALEYYTITLHHQVGTCKMGPQSDSSAVVDPRLRVYNTGNLRVIDTSVLPQSISAHTNAPAFMIGEKGADMIKEDYGVITI